MQGFRVDRKAGWDCQGLHVEVGVEKELGLSGKKDIEAYGIAEFNARCRESVVRYVDAFEAMTERMGYWVDVEHPYRTMDSVLHRERLVVPQADLRRGPAVRGAAGLAVLPALRDHAVRPRARAGVRDGDRPVGVRPDAADVRSAGRPGVAAGLDDHAMDAGVQHRGRGATRRHLRGGDRRHRVAGRRRAAARTGARRRLARRGDVPGLGDGALDVRPAIRPRRLPGSGALRRARRLRHDRRRHRAGAPGAGVRRSPTSRSAWRTGCRSSSRCCRTATSPTTSPLVGGQFFKHADNDLVRELERNGRLFRHVAFEHSYPHCWRCHTPLMYYASPAWYIRTTQVKDALLRENEQTTWFPETIKWGRYGDWLRNNVDWSLSRTRYWGTPLPIWRCDAGHLTCVGSLAELGALAGEDLSRARPAPAVRRRRGRSPAEDTSSGRCLRRAGPSGQRGDRRVVRLGLDAVRPVGVPVRRRVAARSSRPPSPRSSSARGSTRLAAGSTR